MVDELSVATIVLEKDPNHDDITQSRECEYCGNRICEESVGGDMVARGNVNGDSVEAVAEAVGSMMMVLGLLVWK